MNGVLDARQDELFAGVFGARRGARDPDLVLLGARSPEGELRVGELARQAERGEIEPALRALVTCRARVNDSPLVCGLQEQLAQSLEAELYPVWERSAKVLLRSTGVWDTYSHALVRVLDSPVVHVWPEGPAKGGRTGGLVRTACGVVAGALEGRLVAHDAWRCPERYKVHNKREMRRCGRCGRCAPQIAGVQSEQAPFEGRDLDALRCGARGEILLGLRKALSALPVPDVKLEAGLAREAASGAYGTQMRRSLAHALAQGGEPAVMRGLGEELYSRVRSQLAQAQGVEYRDFWLHRQLTETDFFTALDPVPFVKLAADAEGANWHAVNRMRFSNALRDLLLDPERCPAPAAR